MRMAQSAMATTRMTRGVWLALAASITAASAAGQTPSAAGPAPVPLTAITSEYVSGPGIDRGAVLQAGCSSCGTAPSGDLPPRPSGDCAGGNCVAGGACQQCEAESGFGRLYCHFYNALCCADPCYEPHWVAAANASLFVDGARPTTQTRLRWDAGHNLILPDRSEFFWARRGGAGGGNGPPNVERRLNYHALTMYQEAGTEKFSAFVETEYRSIDSERNGHSAGFGDLTIGTKSLLLDTDVVQITLQTKTFIPTASAGKGFGTGHVSLEPSLLTAIKLHPDTYFQGQLAEWIPLGGDGAFAGAVLHYHASLNHVVCRPFVDSQFIATLEFNGYSFQDGLFTDPVTGAAVRSSGGNYFGVGPGFRWVISQHCDFGFGVNFSVTRQHLADQLYRSELRLRF